MKGCIMKFKLNKKIWIGIICVLFVAICLCISGYLYRTSRSVALNKSRLYPYFDKMEMLFEGVRHFRFSGRNDSNVSTINGYSLEIRTELLGKTRNNKLIVWTDYCKVEHHNGYFDFEKDNCIVIADSLKYRFIV